MRILALETSGERCSAALLVNDAVLERAQLARRAHAEMILPMVESLLAEASLSLASLDAIAFGRGPGAFTGVRVATAVAQGLAFGAGKPVAPISDLAALAAAAQRVHGAGQVLACLDARMQEVYWGAFEMAGKHAARAIGEERLGTAGSVQAPGTGAWFGAGSGFGVYAETLRAALGGALAASDASLAPTAIDIAWLAADVVAAGRGVTAEQALPVYLRDRVAQPKARL